MAKKGKADERPSSINLDEPISQAAYARARKVTRQFIGKLVKLEKIKLHAGKVIPHEADKARADFADPSREHRTKEQTPDAGKAGSCSEPEESGEDSSDKKFINQLKREFTPEEIKILERAINKIPSWNLGQRFQSVVKALNESMIYERERGNLVDAELSKQFLIDKLSMVRAKLLTLPKKMVSALSAFILKYAAKMGQALYDNAASIRKKGKGPGWLYDKKTDDLILLAGKSKKAFVRIPLSLEAPDHAEARSLTDIEQTLTAEVSEALNELVEEGDSK